MKKIFVVFFLSFLFIGCSKTNSSAIAPKTDASSEQDIFDDFDDFDNEFETQAVYDPLEGYNRIMTSFNDKVYIYLLDPIASSYAYIVPRGGRVAIKNFFYNLETPVRLTNNVLQFKFKRASIEGGRFVANTIFGLGGFFDPAKSDLGWESYDEDFGQTLGSYGVGEGIPIVWPFLGPSNIRDSVGLAADSFISPLPYLGDHMFHYDIPQTTAMGAVIKAYKVINKTSLQLGQYESIKKDALDFYPFLRDSYKQLREQQIKE